MEFKVWEITAENENGDQHTWDVFESPTGETVDVCELHADQWYDSVDDVEAYGLDNIVSCKATDRTCVWSEPEIRHSVRKSARSYGKDAIPETLKRWLN